MSDSQSRSRDRISNIVDKATEKSQSATEHHEAGVALASQRRFAGAVKQYLRAARLNPNFSDAFYNLGVAYGELGEWKAAIKAYRKAIQLNPKDWQAYGNLGVDYTHSRQYTKAIDAFRRASELNPGEMTLFVSLGYNCGRLRRYSEAIEAYSHAVRLKPDFAIGWYNIGLFHFLQRHFDDAVLAAERAMAIDPAYQDEPNSIIGMVRRKTGDLEGAIAAFKQAAESNPSFMEAHANLGEAFLRCKQIDASIRQLQWTIQLRPEEPWPHRMLALAHWKRGEVILAVDDCCKAMYLYLRKMLTNKT